MSKKTLLNETQVRRFMKLATLGSLSDGFVDGLSEAGYFPTIAEEEEEPLEDELPGDEGPEDAMDLGAEEEPAMDMDLGIEDEPAMGDAAGESLPPEVVAQVEDALASALGAMEQELEAAIPELDLSVEQEGSEEADLDLAPEDGMDLDAPEEEPADLEAELSDEMPGEEGPALEDELVERIVRRVAKRIRSHTSK